MTLTKLMAILLVSTLLSSTTVFSQASPTIRTDPLREAYYGDLHLHTSYSLDAYIGHGTKVGPDEAYRFAKGEIIQYLGEPKQRGEPLDFMAITDHAENIGVFNQLEDPSSAVSRSALGKAVALEKASSTLADGRLDKKKIWPSLIVKYQVGDTNPLPDELKAESASAWQRMIEAANRHYNPGVFTTFIGYEWTSQSGEGAVHRNVIFKGKSAPYPFTSFDSRQPENLWIWLDKIREQGHEALAIPHNSNLSNGLMYDWAGSDGKAIDRAYAELRLANEPLSEISQSKGSSETHPLLSSSDEYSDFEIIDRSVANPGGSYLRSALSRGLILQHRLGVNPYKDGFVGGSDFHSGLSSSVQAGYAAEISGYGADPTKDQTARILFPDRDASAFEKIPLKTTAGNLTGVWAESNTRESIYDALRRKETFATSGTRLKFRFFGGWNFNTGLFKNREWVHAAYRGGVPMGGDLPAMLDKGKAPTFVVWAVKDPNGANLDRVQVIKVWEQDGQAKEKVFDVVWSGDRKLNSRTGKLPAIGNSVDLTTANDTNEIGATELKAVWSDPHFDSRCFAVYYLRVLEIPTPRWSTLLAIRHSLPLPNDVSATVQQRGWSSPIWYQPAVW